MPYRLFQGNLNPKDLKRHKIATQSFIFPTNEVIGVEYLYRQCNMQFTDEFIDKNIDDGIDLDDSGYGSFSEGEDPSSVRPIIC